MKLKVSLCIFLGASLFAGECIDKDYYNLGEAESCQAMAEGSGRGVGMFYSSNLKTKRLKKDILDFCYGEWNNKFQYIYDERWKTILIGGCGIKAGYQYAE